MEPPLNSTVASGSLPCPCALAANSANAPAIARLFIPKRIIVSPFLPGVTLQRRTVSRRPCLSARDHSGIGQRNDQAKPMFADNPWVVNEIPQDRIPLHLSDETTTRGPIVICATAPIQGIEVSRWVSFE